MEKRCSSPNGFINLEIIAIEKEKKMKSGRKVMRSGVVLAVVAVCLLGRVVPGRAQEDNLKEKHKHFGLLSFIPSIESQHSSISVIAFPVSDGGVL
ncbi:hypothetical protein Csa_000781 [Cucumis sativus]|nr:hypothetical protein Csa_000781 [Cucumis sativus]